MALKIPRYSDVIEVIPYVDGAVKCSRDEYENYLKSFSGRNPDETILKLEGEASRFVLKRFPEWQDKHKLRSKNIKHVGGEVNVDANFTSEMLRDHLVAIKHPAGVKGDEDVDFTFSKDSDGLVSRALISRLDDYLIVGDLIGALTNSKPAMDKDKQQKNS